MPTSSKSTYHGVKNPHIITIQPGGASVTSLMEGHMVGHILNTLQNVGICDSLWENPPVTQKDNYLEKCN